MFANIAKGSNKGCQNVSCEEQSGVLEEFNFPL